MTDPVKIYDMTDEWNEGSTEFVAIKMDVTDTASAAGSKLINLLVGGAPQFTVDKNGNLSLSGTTDGRDVAADGTKLDGISPLADVTNAASVAAAGALMDSEVASLSGIKTLTVPDSTTVSTFGATLVDDVDAAAARATLGISTGGGDMAKATYDPANIVQQLVGLTAAQVMTNKTLTAPILSSYADYTPIAAPAHAEGRLFYDSNRKALTYYNDKSDVSNQIGQELWSHVYNGTGVTILNGSVVYVSGANVGAGLPEVSLAQANSLATAIALGVATHDILNNSTGYVTVFGEVGGLTTTGLVNGATLYLSPTVPGGYTLTRPSRPNMLVEIGTCTKVAGGGNGEIEVKITHDIGAVFPEANTVGANTEVTFFNANGALETSPNLTFDGTSLGVIGNVVVSGAVDGRDVSADGAKLDGVEPLADVTDAANVTAAGALMDSEVASLPGIKTLVVPDSTTISAFGATLIDDAAASNARTTLGLGTSSTLDETTSAQWRSNTPDKILSTDQVWSAMTEVTLTDGASVAWDMNAGFDFVVTLAGNRTLANPTNAKVGQRGRIRVVQDATGGRTLSYGSSIKFASGTAPVLSTPVNTIDHLDYDVVSSVFIRVTLSKAWA